jgi:hypothetical protein
MVGLIRLTLVNTLLTDSAAEILFEGCNVDLKELDLSKNK